MFNPLSLRQIFARMDDIQMERLRNAVEDEIRQRDEVTSELGTLWPTNGKEPPLAARSRGIAALLDILTRGASYD